MRTTRSFLLIVELDGCWDWPSFVTRSVTKGCAHALPTADAGVERVRACASAAEDELVHRDLLIPLNAALLPQPVLSPVLINSEDPVRFLDTKLGMALGSCLLYHALPET